MKILTSVWNSIDKAVTSVRTSKFLNPDEETKAKQREMIRMVELSQRHFGPARAP